MKHIDWKDRARAGAIHLGISATVAALAALLVFLVWYPWPYRAVSGGRELFGILVTVDVILGPLLTFAVFDRAKGWPVLRRDLAVIGLTQLLALGYGMWTVFEARPVFLAFEYDRFRVVHAIEVPAESLERAPAALRRLPLFGPQPVALRDFHDSKEQLERTMTALKGLSLSAQPELWQPYADATARVLAAAKPVTTLAQRFPAQAAEIDAAVRETGRTPEQLRYLPMASRKLFWTVLLDAGTAAVVGYVEVDSF